MSVIDGPETVDYDSRPETIEHINQVRFFLSVVADDLHRRALEHDRSKLESPEVEVFNEFTPKLKNSTYDSPEYKVFLEQMGEGLAHHYKNNRHHPEYHARGIRGMNLIDLIEMFVDWKAASMRHADGDIRASIEKNSERFRYSEELIEIFMNTADALDELVA